MSESAFTIWLGVREYLGIGRHTPDAADLQAEAEIARRQPDTVSLRQAMTEYLRNPHHRDSRLPAFAGEFKKSHPAAVIAVAPVVKETASPKAAILPPTPAPSAAAIPTPATPPVKPAPAPAKTVAPAKPAHVEPAAKAKGASAPTTAPKSGPKRKAGTRMRADTGRAEDHRGRSDRQWWVKLWRKSLDSAVWADANLWRTWSACLMLANRKAADVFIPGVSKAIHVEAGQFITGRFSFHQVLFPRHSDLNPHPTTTWRWLEALQSAGNLRIESRNKFTLITIEKWAKYQSSETPDAHENEAGKRNRRAADAQQTRTNKKKYKKIEKGFVPPSLEQIQSYCLERKNGLDAQKWLDYYASNGWRVGRNPMVDWQAAVRTWERNDRDRATKQHTTREHNLDTLPSRVDAVVQKHGQEVAKEFDAKARAEGMAAAEAWLKARSA